jgi:hypothetical protein
LRLSSYLGYDERLLLLLQQGSVQDNLLSQLNPIEWSAASTFV